MSEKRSSYKYRQSLSFIGIHQIHQISLINLILILNKI